MPSTKSRFILLTSVYFVLSVLILIPAIKLDFDFSFLIALCCAVIFAFAFFYLVMLIYVCAFQKTCQKTEGTVIGVERAGTFSTRNVSFLIEAEANGKTVRFKTHKIFPIRLITDVKNGTKVWIGYKPDKQKCIIL